MRILQKSVGHPPCGLGHPPSVVLDRVGCVRVAPVDFIRRKNEPRRERTNAEVANLSHDAGRCVRAAIAFIRNYTFPARLEHTLHLVSVGCVRVAPFGFLRKKNEPRRERTNAEVASLSHDAERCVRAAITFIRNYMFPARLEHTLHHVRPRRVFIRHSAIAIRYYLLTHPGSSSCRTQLV